MQYVFQMFYNMLQICMASILYCTQPESQNTSPPTIYCMCVAPEIQAQGMHMQLHYEYFKSDSIRVTLMSKYKIMFILHFVSLHSKVSELEILDSCCSVFFWNLECLSSQYSKLLQLNFTICFHSKVNFLKVVIKAMAPIFLLWVNFLIRFY